MADAVDSKSTGGNPVGVQVPSPAQKFEDSQIFPKNEERNAEVAQLVEQLIRNQQVRGSNPLFGSTHINSLGIFQ